MKPTSPARLVVLSILLLAAGCASAPYATFNRVALDGQAGQISGDNLQVQRDGEFEEVLPDTELEVGDRVETRSTYGAVIGFRPGASLVMAPSTSVSFAENAVELHRGKVLFRPAGEISRLRAGNYTVIPQTAALVESDDSQRVRITALGRPAGVEAPGTPTTRVDHANTVDGGGGQPRQLTRDQFNAITQWANGIDRPDRRLTPDVTGLHHQAASEVIRRAGMQAQTRPVPVESHEIGLVKAQSPLPGGSAPGITIDVGAESVLAADLVTMTLDQARTQLAQNGNAPGTITKRLNASRDEPIVVSQEPAAGTRVLKGSAIALVVEFPGSVVPTLRGVPQDAAMTLVRDAKLKAAIGSHGHYASVPKGHVVNVDPGAGALIERGAEVRLRISDGPLPAPQLNSPASNQRAICDPMGTVAFNWAQARDIERYQIQVWQGETMLTEETVPGSTNDYSCRPRWTRDRAGDMYSWCVRGMVNGEWGEWSNRSPFEYEPPDIRVPVLAGLQWSDPRVQRAVQYLQVDQRQEYSADQPAGTILSCDRDGAFVAKPGEPLTVYISKGRDPSAPVAIPDWGSNPDISIVQNDLRGLGLVVRITEEYSDTVPQGREIRRSKASGAMVTPGTVVECFVSKGPNPFLEGSFHGNVTTLGRGYNAFLERNAAPTSPVLLFDRETRTVKPNFGNFVSQVPSNLLSNTFTDASISDYSFYNSYEEAKQKFSASLDIEAEYRIYSGELHARYEFNSRNTSQQSLLCYRVGTKVLHVKFDDNKPRRYPQPVQEQIDWCRNSPYGQQTRGRYETFFNTYGTHFVTGVTLGAECAMHATVTNTTSRTSHEFEVNVRGEVDGLFAGGSIEAGVAGKIENFRSKYQANVKFVATGGTQSIITTGRTVNDTKWEAWMRSVEQLGPVEIGCKLEPIWKLPNDSRAQANMRAAWNDYTRSRLRR